MKRHATVDELASLAADDLRPRKAAKIRSHMATCTHCTYVSKQLDAVPDMLASASVQFSAMPDHLSVKVETALTVESTQRLASAPQTEAGRRDLPARSRRADSSRRGWRLPGLSGPATRVLAAAGALVIIGGGGYEIASHLGNNVSGTASSSSEARPGAVPNVHAGQLAFGPSVTYRHDGVTQTIRAIRTDTDFVAAKLAVQTVAAMRAARFSGVQSSGVTNSTAQPSPSADKAASGKIASPGSDSLLTGCVNLVAANRTVLLVELARYEGRPARIIVIMLAGTPAAEVFVVGQACSASNRDVLTTLNLAHT